MRNYILFSCPDVSSILATSQHFQFAIAYFFAG